VSVVRVPIARVERGVADLRAEPRADAELVDQVRFGERLTLLAEQDDWYFVQAREDHYFGWIQDADVRETDEVPGDGVVNVLLASSSRAPGGPDSFRLPAGTWLELGGERGGVLRVRHPWVDLWVNATDVTRASDLEARPPSRADLVMAARAFLDVPYLWGGTSAKGIDCSGLVQLAYRLCGIVLTRDADQQATQGRAAEGDRQAGDLLFFGAPVTHVAMYTEAGKIIHAADAPIGRVVEQPAAERGTPVSVRRYLP